MKKLTKVLGGIALAALLSTFAACKSNQDATADDADNSGDTTTGETTAVVYSGDEITLTANKASKSASDVQLIIKYDRTAVGAAEKITLENVDLSVTLNGTAISMADKLEFTLDPYSSLDPNYKEGKEETRADYKKDYKVKIDLKKAIKSGDVLKIKLNSATVSGEGADKVNLGSIVVALIDASSAANYYAELCPDEYKSCLITMKNGKALDAAEEPAATPTPTETPATTDPETPAETPATTDPETPGEEETPSTLPEGAVAVELRDAINCEKEPDATNDIKWQEKDAENGAVVCCWGSQTVADPRHSARIYSTALTGANVGDILCFTVSGEGTCYQIDNQDWASYKPTLYDFDGNEVTDYINSENDAQYVKNGTFVILLTQAMLKDGIEFHGAATISNVFYMNAEEE